MRGIGGPQRVGDGVLKVASEVGLGKLGGLAERLQKADGFLAQPRRFVRLPEINVYSRQYGENDPHAAHVAASFVSATRFLGRAHRLMPFAGAKRRLRESQLQVREVRAVGGKLECAREVSVGLGESEEPRRPPAGKVVIAEGLVCHPGLVVVVSELLRVAFPVCASALLQRERGVAVQ